MATPENGKQAIVTMKHLAEDLSKNHDLSKKLANAILADFVGLVTKALKKGAKIRIPDFGIMQVRKRPARMGRNPATGAQIKIKPSKRVAFRASKTLKEAV
ncbi:MAG: HU family DNA-binding protein [Rhodospirillaceae bacterium]|nr:HU family DNA-binding protein [Rhodospirillaceae bacterium]